MSTIYTIKKNLENTIKGKEAYLAEINIRELKVILNDVNTAAEEHSLAMWEINPERMGQ